MTPLARPGWFRTPMSIVPVPDVRIVKLSNPDEKLSCDHEPRSGERSLAWGVSPRMRERQNETSRGAATEISRPWLRFTRQPSICRPLRGLSKFSCAANPGAHAPGYEYVAPSELFVKCQPISRRDTQDRLGRSNGCGSLFGASASVVVTSGTGTGMGTGTKEQFS